MTTRSIPEVYAGVQMRSRLEAAWARFFDSHGIAWAYEVEGFNLNGVLYLPDFWLPQQHVIVEVKGLLDTKDRAKLQRLAVAAAGVDTIVIMAEAPVGREFSWIKPVADFTVTRDAELVCCEACRRWTFTVTTTKPGTDEYAEYSRDCRYVDHEKGSDGRWVSMGSSEVHSRTVVACRICDGGV